MRKDSPHLACPKCSGSHKMMCDPDAQQLREEGVRQTPKSLGKIINKIDNLELKMHNMSTSEDRGREPP